MTKDNNPWTGLSSNEDFYDDNPWPGLSSYEDPTKSDRKLKFCGRDNDIYDVTRLIDDNLLLILYGKSGIGKTSLLNAGVFPELRKEQYLPVSIRLGTLEVSASYQEAIVYAIEKAIEKAHGSINVYHVVEEQTDNHHPDLLWNYFARHRFANAEGQPLFPVVVLDQFEEVLRNTSPEHVEKAQTLLNQLQYLLDESHALNDCVVDGQDYFYDFNFRFIISIREDELYLLEDNIDDLSLSMFRNCRYRLRSLSEQGATEAILLPGKDCIVEEQKQAVVDRVIELSKRPQSNDIDTLLLSLVCAGTYDKKVGEKIALSDLAVWKNNPMELYYQETIKGLSASQVRYIQQYLIREDGSRRRVDAEEVKKALGEVTYQQLTQGANRLFAIGDKGQVELLHDQLGMAVYEERKAFEQRKRKHKKVIALICFVGLAAVGVFIYYSHNQRVKLKGSNWKMLENQSRYIAEKALRLSKEDSYLASRLLLNVLPEDVNHPSKPITTEAENAFREIFFQGSTILIDDNIKQVEQPQPAMAIYSPDGNYIACLFDDYYSIDIWKVKTGLKLHKIVSDTLVTSINFSPDNSLFLVSQCDGSIQILNVKTCELVQLIEGCHKAVSYATFSPDGKQIASAYDDGGVVVWDVASGLTRYSYIVHHNRINYLSYGDNGKILASASEDSTVVLFNTITREMQMTFKHTAPVSFVCFNPNEPKIITFSTKKDETESSTKNADVLQWDMDSGKIVDILFSNEVYEQSVSPLSISLDWSKFSYIAGRGDLTIYDIEHEVELKVIQEISSSSFSPNGKQIVCITKNGGLRIIDTEYLSDTRIIRGHSDVVHSVAFDPSGSIIASGSGDKTIKLWDVITGNLIGTFLGHTDVVCSVSFSPSGKQIVSASVDSTIKIWDVEKGITIQTLKGHKGAVLSAVFSSNGEKIASSSCDNMIIIWNANDFGVEHELDGHTGTVISVAFSPDGKLVASASEDGTIRIWDVENGKTIKQLIGHSGAVKSVEFNCDGNLIISSSDDNTIKILSTLSSM